MMKLNIGIYNLHMQAMGGGEKLTLVMAEHLSLTHNVWLFCSDPPDVPLLEQFFDVDLSRVNFVPLRKNDSLSRVIAKVRNNTPLNLPHPHFRKLQEFNLDLFINNSFASDLSCPARMGIFMCMFPHPLPQTKIVDSYSKVVAISRYTAHWVKELWKRDAEVIYPSCDDMGPPAQKDNIILHVGRLIADSDEDERPHKGQGVLLEAFERLSTLRDRGWQLREDENRAVADYMRWLTLAVHQKQSEYESLLANSPTLRLRNQLGRLPLVDQLLNRLRGAARGDGSPDG